PLQVTELVDDSQRPKVVFLETLDDLFERRTRRHRAHLATHELRDGSPARSAHETHERRDPEELAVFADERDLVQLWNQILVDLLERGQRLSDRPLGSTLEKVGRHQPA